MRPQQSNRTSNRRRLATALACALAWSAPAGAQLRLPQLPMLQPPAAADLAATAQRAPEALDPLRRVDLRGVRIRELLQRHPELIETDPRGAPAVRAEIVALSPAPAALDAARAAGFMIAGERSLEGLDDRLVVLRVPAGMTTADGLQRLRALDPQGTYDFNHLYLGSGDAMVDSQRAYADAPTAPRARAATPRIGLIDGGVDLRHPALRVAEVHVHGCAGESMPTAHGTAVASLLVGHGRRFSGAAPDAELYAADIFCAEPTGGALARLLDAFAWLARERVRVINISLVGPPNAALERVVRSLLARGLLLVAAVGNDGPAAPPLYPAAYPGVIAVTGVDARDRVLPKAARGTHVMFAAPGADLMVASSDSEAFVEARGTSYAAPLVAGLLARLAVDARDNGEAVDALIQSAVDLGPRGRDPIYGYGLVAQQLRVSPLAIR